MITPPMQQIYSYLIQGDTINVPVVVTQKITVPDWTASEIIRIGEYCKGTVEPECYFQVTVPGRTGTVEPDWAIAANLGETISDNSVTWLNMGELTLIEGSDNTAKLPVDISNCTVIFIAKTALEDDDQNAQVRHEWTISQDDDSMVGKFVGVVPASESRNLIPGKVFVGIKLAIPASPEAIIKTLNIGKVQVYASPIRNP